MRASQIIEFDPLADFRRVEGKTLSFFAPDENSTRTVDRAMLNTLVAESIAVGRRNARVCLHSSPEAPFHEMLILEWKGSYFPPHRHPTKAESIHIIKGDLHTMAFNDDGTMTFYRLLGKGGALLTRFGPNQWHFTIPSSAHVIYIETKLGPFLGENDREFAPWAATREGELRNIPSP